MPIKHVARIVSTKRPMHIILKTDTGVSFSEKKAVLFIKGMLTEIEKRYLVTIVQFYFAKNHLHLLILVHFHHHLSVAMQFLKSKIAIRFNNILGRKGRFWSDRFFSAVKSSAREIRNVIYYIANQAKGRMYPLRDDCSSLFHYQKFPYNFPPEILNAIGCGSNSTSFMRIILQKNYCPYVIKTATAKKVGEEQLALF